MGILHFTSNRLKRCTRQDAQVIHSSLQLRLSRSPAFAGQPMVTPGFSSGQGRPRRVLTSCRATSITILYTHHHSAPHRSSTAWNISQLLSSPGSIHCPLHWPGCTAAAVLRKKRPSNCKTRLRAFDALAIGPRSFGCSILLMIQLSNHRTAKDSCQDFWNDCLNPFLQTFFSASTAYSQAMYSCWPSRTPPCHLYCGSDAV